MQYHGEESSKIRENLDLSCQFFSCQLSVVSCQLSVVSCQLSVVSRTCRTGQTCPTENLLTDLDKIKNWLL